MDEQSVRLGLAGTALLAGLLGLISVIHGGRYAGQTGGISVLLIGVAVEQFSAGTLEEPSRTFGPIVSLARPVGGAVCAISGIGLMVIADPAGAELYYGIGLLLVVQAGRLLVSFDP